MVRSGRMSFDWKFSKKLLVYKTLSSKFSENIFVPTKYLLKSAVDKPAVTLWLYTELRNLTLQVFENWILKATYVSSTFPWFKKSTRLTVPSYEHVKSWRLVLDQSQCFTCAECFMVCTLLGKKNSCRLSELNKSNTHRKNKVLPRRCFDGWKWRLRQ